MKRKNIALLALLGGAMLCATGLVACDDPNAPHTHKFEQVIDGSTFTMECDCGEVFDGYMLQFVYAEDGSKADADIEVSWTSDTTGTFSAKTNSLGYVQTDKLPEQSYTFTVNEDTLPVIDGVKYCYNTTKFNEQTKGVGIIIPLIAIHETDGETILSLESGDTPCNYISLDKTYAITLESLNDCAWFILQNDGFGKYTVDATMTEGINVEIVRYFGSEYYVNPVPDTKTDTSISNKMTYTVLLQDSEQISMFCIKAPTATSFPLQILFNVSITYNATDVSVASQTLIKPTFFETEPCTYTYYTTERGSNTKIEQTTKSLKPVGIDKWQDVEGAIISDLSATQFENISLHDDGYYYTNDNKLVFAKIDTTSIFMGITLADYLFDSNPPSFAIYLKTEQNEYGCYTRRDNYFGFVQAYAALVNSDGLYPLTDEMLSYLTFVAKKEHKETYNLLCTYPKQTNSFAVGDGSLATPYELTLESLTLGNYNLSVAQGEKVYVKLIGNMNVTLSFNSNVKAKIGSSNYSDYVAVNGEVIVCFETKDGSSLDFVLGIDEYDDPYYLEVGENQVFALTSATLTYEFIAPSAGNYDVSVSTTLVNASIKQGQDGEAISLDGTYTITLTQGESLFFTITTEYESDLDFSIIIQIPQN